MLVGVPWAPELFSAPVLQNVLDKYRREHLRSLPFFEGLLSGEVDALVGSFAGVPEVHHPVRGRIKGEHAFRHFVAEMGSWMDERVTDVEHVNFLVTDARAVEEVVLHLDGGSVAMPVAVACDHVEDGRIAELRLYFSTVPLTGRRTDRPPLLQPDGELRAPGFVADYLRGFATGDIALEPCAVADDGRACALEYNMLEQGATMPCPEAGLAVFARGSGDLLAATRVYGDAAPATPGAGL
jgi:ketosteroid isomerase-like protein